MANLIPLGILAAIKKLLSWSAVSFSGLGTTGDRTFRGAGYADLANAKYFGFGANSGGVASNVYLYSTDAASWSSGTLPASKTWGKSATNGTRLVVVSQSSDTVGAYTDNGTTWTSTTILGTAANMYDILWDGTRFLVVANNASANLAHSTDGVTWTRIDIGDPGLCIGYDGSSRYIYGQGVGAATATCRTTTSNPTVVGNWSNLTMPATGRWLQFMYTNNRWLAISATSTTAYYSDNGTTWTATTLPTSITDDSANETSARGLAYNGRFYVALGGATGNVTIYSSSDTITWDTEAALTGVGTDLTVINGWAAGPSTVVGFGLDDTADGSNGAIVGIR